jgi:phytoene synthase
MSAEIQEEAKDVLKKHAKSFRWASVFLAPRQRTDAAIAYAFCRYVDDVVDEATSPQDAEKELDRVLLMLTGKVTPSPLLEAFLEVSERTGFGVEPALDLLLGVRSDLHAVRIKDSEELSLYCYRVAGTVGLMMCGILGVKDPRAKQHAIDLGVAMQLTNICRDVLEDAERGRVYLPASQLARRGISQEELKSALLAPGGANKDLARRAAGEVIFDLLVRADAKYLSARSGFPYLPGRARLSIMIASELYRHIGVRLRTHHNCDPCAGRVSVTPAQKASLTTKVVLDWLVLSSKELSRVESPQPPIGAS